MEWVSSTKWANFDHSPSSIFLILSARLLNQVRDDIPRARHGLSILSRVLKSKSASQTENSAIRFPYDPARSGIST
jgi:hypothetical protein